MIGRKIASLPFFGLALWLGGFTVPHLRRWYTNTLYSLLWLEFQFRRIQIARAALLVVRAASTRRCAIMCWRAGNGSSASQLFINGQKVESTFLHSERASNEAADVEVWLGKNEFCVLGDNLDHSVEDSRSFGPISSSLVRGRVGWVIHHACGKNTQ